METKKYYWKTKDGKEINVDDMTESHLRNVLKLILKKSESSGEKSLAHNFSNNCFCGDLFDGVECASCGFDAKVDIY